MIKQIGTRITTLILALAMVAVFTACGGGKNNTSSSSVAPSSSQTTSSQTSSESSSVPSQSANELSQRFSDAIVAAREKEINEVMSVQTTFDPQGDAYLFELLGFAPEDVEAMAASVSMMNVKAYGIVVAKPAAGRTEAVENGLKGYVEYQKKAFEQYLVDQKEIADNAIVKTLADGTVIMVMSEDQENIYNKIVSALEK